MWLCPYNFWSEIVIIMGDMIKAVKNKFDLKSGSPLRLSFCPIGQNGSIFKTMIGNGKF